MELVHGRARHLPDLPLLHPDLWPIQHEKRSPGRRVNRLPVDSYDLPVRVLVLGRRRVYVRRGMDCKRLYYALSDRYCLLAH